SVAKRFARANWLGQRGRWKEAAADLVEAVRLDPEDHYAWFNAVITLGEAGETEAFRERRKAMLQRYGEATDTTVAERTAKAGLLWPAEGEERKRLVALAARAAKEPSLGVWGVLAAALGELRDGQPGRAVERLRTVRDGAPPDDSFPGVLGLV